MTLKGVKSGCTISFILHYIVRRKNYKPTTSLVPLLKYFVTLMVNSFSKKANVALVNVNVRCRHIFFSRFSKSFVPQKGSIT